MAQALSILASCRSEETLESVRGALEGMNGARVELRNGALLNVMNDISSGRRIDVMLLDVDLEDDTELGALSEVIERSPQGLPVIATSNRTSIERVRLLMRLGLADFIPQPISREDLLNSIAVVHRTTQTAAPREVRTGKVVSFLRASGGVGSTTVAIHTALALAGEKDSKRSVCLVDLDLQGGCVGLYLDIESPVTILDCLTTPDRIDQSLVNSAISHHGSGIDLVTSPMAQVPLEEVSTYALETVLHVLRSTYDVVLVELPQAWTTWTGAVLQASNAIVLVTQVTVASIHKTRKLMESLELLGFDDMLTLLVANRFEKRRFGGGITFKEAETSLRRSIDMCLPSDFKLVAEAINSGVPIPEIKSRTKFMKSIGKLSETLLQQFEENSERAVVLSQSS
jgi:pilus assembly protein CpaE